MIDKRQNVPDVAVFHVQRRQPQSDGERRSIRIYSRTGAPVVAVNDGRIVTVGESRRLGRFVVLQDVYGNEYTYAETPTVAGLSASGGNVAGGNTITLTGSGFTGTTAVDFGGTAAAPVARRA